MLKPLRLTLLALVFTVTGCSSYNIGENHSPDGSYAGGTLNSPVTDQNPHEGGVDSTSYPTSSAAGKEQQPVERSTY